MKEIKTYIIEKLKVTKYYTLFPKSSDELKQIIKDEISKKGINCSLNHIDVSEITDMSYMFCDTTFMGDISKWDVSNVTNMGSMFYGCKAFNQNISKWNVSKVINTDRMFFGCESFNQNISNWNVSNVKNNKSTFYKCPIEEKYKPKFK